MESEERPAKMRKLEHASATVDAAQGASVSAPATLDAPSDAVEQSPAAVEIEAGSAQDNAGDDDDTPKMSKNQLKKQRRLERWESGREDRKVKRREKIKAKKQRRKQEWDEYRDGTTSQPPEPPARFPRHGVPPGVQVPITILFDCDFEEYMHEHELKSLGLQITRSYSDNRKAPFRVHLGISSWGGKLKERFDGVLGKQYTSWKGFQFSEEDFVKMGEASKEWMKGPKGGEVAGALAKGETGESNDAADEEGEIVYLSAESDNTLERLKPNSTYIIGGLVDKNRHKGLCYKRALDRGIKTAKLPIGEFLQMDSRRVLVTNHVLEIMLKWMEHDDWGKAFMEVLPKRKGGKLKTEDDGEDTPSEARGAADEDAQEEDDANVLSADDDEVESPAEAKSA